MVYGGDCIAKIDGKTVFVPYAIPGEKLEVEIEKENRDYSVAKIVNILEPSPKRVEPFCKYYGVCGGCNMQHISDDYQKELRKSILEDAFIREDVDFPEVKVISASPTAYRTRFQFHDGGMMQKLSNSIVPIENCPCASKEINKYLSEIPFEQRPRGRIHVFGSEKIVSIPDDYDKIIVADDSLAQKRISEKKSRPQAGKRVNGKKIKQIRPRFEGTVSVPVNACTVRLCGKDIAFDVQGFFQSNLDVLEETIPKITEGLGGKNVLDMYAGCGTFSVFLADLFENVVLVEHNRDALVFAEQNLAGKKHESFGLSGETWTKYHAQTFVERNGAFDAAVVDPPRSGMEKSVRKWLSESGIPSIRSLSCDIATQARDVKFLVRNGGYKLKELYLLDFYPQTGHIESLAVLEK